MATIVRTAAKTVKHMTDISDELLVRLRDSLVLIDHPQANRVVVEVRVKQVFDEEAPEDS
tara:strand:- start:860 stop:1039 length:180 start_codon:yes stop_codon:yes gene_type:complete